MKIKLKFNKRGEYLIFSLPQTNHYQTISNMVIPPVGWKIVKDERWGNKIAVFTLNDVENYMEIDFNIKPKPCFLSIDKNYKINNYSQKLLNKHSLYLKPNRFINGNDSQIKQLAEKIIAKENNLNNIVTSLYLFTLDYLTYGRPTEGLYTYKQAIEERTTDCGGYSTFLSSLLQSQNIPSRLVVGFIVKNNLLTQLLSGFEFCALSFEFLKIHAWLEVMLPDRSWFPIDASTGKFGEIPANRLVTSFGCDFNIKINNKNYQIDLLQKSIYL